jgi:hypothetical protein
MVIIGWEFLGTSESPLIIAAPPDAHDFGIVRNPEEFATVFNQYPEGRFMSINEFIGYIHANNSGVWMKEDAKLTLNVGYDPHYCQYFDNRTSSWNLELADWLEEESGKISAIKVDGKKIPLSTAGLRIPVPTGSGEHKIEVEF